MKALTFDNVREDWATSTGMVLDEVDSPTLSANGRDQSQVVVRVKYAGFCGTDRGIWWRKSFGDMINASLEEQGGHRRTFGHEMLGEIVEMGARVGPKYGYAPGDIVSTESHIVCGTCHQCRLGEFHVCARERIIGITVDGCFAEYVKLPAKALWPTDLSAIRPEVAAIQEPFGNAVHACQVTDLRGKTVAILGTGAIGQFAILVAKGMGARRVIGIEPDPIRQELARQLGADEVLTPARPDPERPWAADPVLRDRIDELTAGVGVDVAMEMAGFNDSMNNAIRIARRGGHVVLFGVRNGDSVLQDAHRIVMNGLQVHAVVGRRLFQTWECTRALLEQRDNGIQDAIWRVILNQGQDTIFDIHTWDRVAFEGMMGRHPKAILKFAG